MRGATIRDVARAADVSVATVSRTLNGFDNVAAATRDRILRIASTLDYVPHSSARALSTRRTDTIGVLLPDLYDEFFSELIRGIDLAARAQGLHLLLSSSHGDPHEAAAALRAMRSRVDAIILMSPQARQNLFGPGTVAGVPLVLLGSCAGSEAGPSFVIDNYAGAFDITRHLLEAGHRQIAFVAGPRDNIEARERLRGYRAALGQAAAANAEWIVEGDFCEESGRRAAQVLAGSTPPDAVFCANDMMAIGCLEGFRDAGFRIPDDIALAGFDDIPIARYVSPPLTTAAVPIAEIGRRAFECCADLIVGRKTDQRHVFQPVLMIRASTASNQTDR